MIWQWRHSPNRRHISNANLYIRLSFSFNNVRYLGHCYGLQFESFLPLLPDVWLLTFLHRAPSCLVEGLNPRDFVSISGWSLTASNFLRRRKVSLVVYKLHIFLSFGCSKFSWFNGIELAWSELAELAQKARKEIADYLSAGKDERARIRVEHIIREDYLVEAMEILELYCDLLLTRFGLIQSMKWVTFCYYFKSEFIFSSMFFNFSVLFSENWTLAYKKQCPLSSGLPLDCNQKWQNWRLWVSFVSVFNLFLGCSYSMDHSCLFPSFHRFQISCVPNTAKSMESYAGQTRLEQLMIGYEETCLFRGGGHKI